MMEKKDILESGMLQRYLLGDLAREEELMVEKALAKDEELAKEYAAMEKDLEVISRENAIAPSPRVKQKILQSLGTELPPSDKVRSLYGRSIFTAMAAALALVFLLSSVWLYQELGRIETEMEVVSSQNERLLNDQQTSQDVLTSLNQQMATIRDVDTEKYVMKGNDRMPNAVAVSYVNHREKKVIMDRSGLPDLPENKSYQLWGDVDGEMIDMGVIPKDGEWAQMKYLDNAVSLNITLEPEGGSDHPTVSELITNIYLQQSAAP